VHHFSFHSEDVTELKFHPFDQTKLFSGSTDGLISIVDLSIPKSDDALISVLSFNETISGFEFVGKRGEYVAAWSTDEVFMLWDIAECTEIYKEDDIKKVGNGCHDYYITAKYENDTLSLATGSKDGEVDILKVTKTEKKRMENKSLLFVTWRS